VLPEEFAPSFRSFLFSFDANVPFCCHGTNMSVLGFCESGGDVLQRTSQPSCTQCTGKSIEDGRERDDGGGGEGWRGDGGCRGENRIKAPGLEYRTGL